MRYLSLFSGMGGFDKGLDDAGWECAGQCEIDEAANAVLAHHWPDKRRWRDVRDVRGADVGTVDLVAGGSPCQDLSVAGGRAGLAGERSRLFYEFARIVGECAPPWFCFENVPGLLSSNKGRDFAVVLGEFTGHRPEVPKAGWRNAGICVGPRYTAAWRVCDAQFYGVPQRRRRVFIVGHSGDRTYPFRVLFESESMPWDIAPRRTPGQGVAGTLGGGAENRGWADDTDRAGAFIPAVTGTLSPGAHPGSYNGQDAASGTLVPMAWDERNIISPTNGSRVGPDLPAPTLHAEALHVAFSIAQPLRANRWGGSDSHGDEGNVVLAFDWQSGGDVRHNVSGSHTSALQASQTPATLQGMAVRRLMPVECLRLQAFPDSWFDGVQVFSRWRRVRQRGKAPERVAVYKPLSDSHKYRLCGNAICTTVAYWLGCRTAAVQAGGVGMGLPLAPPSGLAVRQLDAGVRRAVAGLAGPRAARLVRRSGRPAGGAGPAAGS